MSDKEMKEIKADLEAIKRLMIFRALSEGHSQAKIAEAIGTSQASISRMMTKKAGSE